MFTVNGQPAALAGDVSKEMVATVTAAPNAVVTLDVGYRSRGLGTWTYAFAGGNNGGGTARVRDFQLTVDTNVVDIDFPAGSMSPNQRTRTADGWRVQWTFNNLLSGQTIGVTLPEKLNPGPFAARVTFFAPVGLLFFLAVMVILGATSGPSLHPMHYWFVAAAFFAFHLLLAYLVDHISVHVAFGVSAAVSLALVVSYLRLVTGMRHALFQAGAAQAVFLVLFSYAFFFEGFTGLAITIGAVITLFVLMQITARVSWDDVFAGGAAAGRRPSGASPWQPLARPTSLEAAAPAVQHKTLTLHTVHPTQFMDVTRLIEAAVQQAGLHAGDRDRADPAHHDGHPDQRVRAAAAGGLPRVVRAAGARSLRLRARRFPAAHGEPDAGRAAERPRALPGGAAAQLGNAEPSAAACWTWAAGNG